MPDKIRIDVDEKFERLEHAPIVEAVLDIRGRADVPLEETALRKRLEGHMPGYTIEASGREFSGSLMVHPREITQSVKDLGWKGLRFRSKDRLHIVQFNRDGFVFSRLKPYDTWEQFKGEALCFWGLYCEIAHPAVQRIGLRFINQIPLPQGELQFEDYIQPHPHAPNGLELPFINFVHADTLDVPGHPYAVRITRTIQLPQLEVGEGVGLILDIDVFTKSPFQLSEDELERKLAEMRWLKNKAFRGSITSKALNQMRGEKK